MPRMMRPPLSASAFSLLALACAAPAATGPAASTAATQPGTLPGAGTPAAIPSSIAFVSLEGPLWVAAQHALLFSDVVEANAAGAAIYRFDPAARSFSRLPYPDAAAAPTTTNGLGLDLSGALLACERTNGRLVKVDASGTRTALADHWPLEGGAALNAPERFWWCAATATSTSPTPTGARAPASPTRPPPSIACLPAAPSSRCWP